MTNKFWIGDKVSVNIPRGVVLDVRGSYSRGMLSAGRGETHVMVPVEWVSSASAVSAGDVFLDETGDKPGVLKVLRVIDEGSYEVSTPGCTRRLYVDAGHLSRCRRLYEASSG